MSVLFFSSSFEGGGGDWGLDMDIGRLTGLCDDDLSGIIRLIFSIGEI